MFFIDFFLFGYEPHNLEARTISGVGFQKTLRTPGERAYSSRYDIRDRWLSFHHSNPQREDGATKPRYLKIDAIRSGIRTSYQNIVPWKMFIFF